MVPRVNSLHKRVLYFQLAQVDTTRCMHSWGPKREEMNLNFLCGGGAAHKSNGSGS